MAQNQSPLSYKKAILFWAPLAATWIMMAVEGPFIVAVVARLPSPTYNLAAFGVALSFAFIADSPIIMLMSASTALATNRESFLKLRRFTHFLNALITIVMLVGLLPPVFGFIANDLIGLPRPVADLTYSASWLFLPWPAAIGFRRFYQGILIRYHLTRRVAYGTLVRLSTMAGSAVILFLLGVKGARTGAAALSIGVLCEAVATRIMAGPVISDLTDTPQDSESTDPTPSYSFILKFYLPLALTSMLALGVHPMVTFFLGKSRMALESLAVLPVVNSLAFVFRSIGLSFQEVGIALMGTVKKNYVILRNFAAMLAFMVGAGYALVGFTPLAKLWFISVSGLNVQLASVAFLPAKLLALLPGLTVMISFQRAILVNAKKTMPIIQATAVEVLVILMCLFFLVYKADLVGVVAAALAYTVGRLASVSYLLLFQNRILRRYLRT